MKATRSRPALEARTTQSSRAVRKPFIAALSLTAAFSLLVLFAPAAISTDEGETFAPEVQVHGALHRIMHDADFSAAVTIGPAVATTETFGVGAVAGLHGEITIVGGRCWVSSVDGGAIKTRIDGGDGVDAALLVTAQVNDWTPFTLAAEASMETLARLTQEHAAAVGLGGETPLTVRISGTLPTLTGHVIDGSRITPEMSHAERHEHAVTGEVFASQPGVVVAFVSDSHQGAFTHRGESIHAHAVLAAEGITVHVDDLLLPPGTVAEIGLTRKPAGAAR